MEETKDYYRQKASEMFKVPYEKVTPAQRRMAKQVFWMEAYDRGANVKSRIGG